MFVGSEEFEAKFREWLYTEGIFSGEKEVTTETFDEFQDKYVRETMGKVFFDENLDADMKLIALHIIIDSTLGKDFPETIEFSNRTIYTEELQAILNRLAKVGWTKEEMDIFCTWINQD